MTLGILILPCETQMLGAIDVGVLKHMKEDDTEVTLMKRRLNTLTCFEESTLLLPFCSMNNWLESMLNYSPAISTQTSDISKTKGTRFYGYVIT